MFIGLCFRPKTAQENADKQGVGCFGFSEDDTAVHGVLLGFHEFGSADLLPLTELPHLDTFFCGWGKDVEHIETVVQLPNLKRLSLIDAEVESMDFLDELDENVFVELCGIRTSREYDIRKLKRFRQRDISELIIAGKEYWLWKEEP